MIKSQLSPAESFLVRKFAALHCDAVMTHPEPFTLLRAVLPFTAFEISINVSPSIPSALFLTIFGSSVTVLAV